MKLVFLLVAKKWIAFVFMLAQSFVYKGLRVYEKYRENFVSM